MFPSGQQVNNKITKSHLHLQMVKDREDDITQPENEHIIDGVQDRFPYDDLQLHDRDNLVSSKFYIYMYIYAICMFAILLLQILLMITYSSFA